MNPSFYLTIPTFWLDYVNHHQAKLLSIFVEHFAFPKPIVVIRHIADHKAHGGIINNLKCVDKFLSILFLVATTIFGLLDRS